eukprot:529575-Alexandrium_andersonii.AAC.1
MVAWLAGPWPVARSPSSARLVGPCRPTAGGGSQVQTHEALAGWPGPRPGLARLLAVAGAAVVRRLA